MVPGSRVAGLAAVLIHTQSLLAKQVAAWANPCWCFTPIRLKPAPTQLPSGMEITHGTLKKVMSLILEMVELRRMRI